MYVLFVDITVYISHFSIGIAGETELSLITMYLHWCSKVIDNSHFYLRKCLHNDEATMCFKVYPHYLTISHGFLGCLHRCKTVQTIHCFK